MSTANPLAALDALAIVHIGSVAAKRRKNRLLLKTGLTTVGLQRTDGFQLPL